VPPARSAELIVRDENRRGWPGLRPHDQRAPDRADHLGGIAR
jgi:hypothetical protein